MSGQSFVCVPYTTWSFMASVVRMPVTMSSVQSALSVSALAGAVHDSYEWV